MPRFTVEFEKHWTEYGKAIVEAEDESAARELAEGMLADGSEEIEWEPSNMDPGDQNVNSVEIYEST